MSTSTINNTKEEIVEIFGKSVNFYYTLAEFKASSIHPYNITNTLNNSINMCLQAITTLQSDIHDELEIIHKQQ